MTSLESMIKKLSPLGVYDLSEKSLVFAELAAFATGLDVLREKLDELLKEAFVMTAEDYGIEILERLVGNVRDDLELSKRREMLIERLSFGTGDFTPQGFKRMLKLMGVEGEVEEYPFTGRIALKLTKGSYTLAQREWIVAQAKMLLPAHLEWDVVFSGFSWAEADASGFTFAELDSKGLTWKTIDYIVLEGES